MVKRPCGRYYALFHLIVADFGANFVKFTNADQYCQRLNVAEGVYSFGNPLYGLWGRRALSLR